MISIIIVLYKSHSSINKCIDLIHDSVLKGIEYEIILINNCKHDNYRFPDNEKLNYKVLKHNHGFAKALNFGVSISKGDIVLSLNPDAFLKKTTIREMFEVLEKIKDVGVVGVKSYDGNGIYNLSSIRRFPTFFNISGLCHSSI